MAADWELPHPDMPIWIRQAARRDSSTCLISRPHGEFAPEEDSERLFSSIGTDSVETTAIGDEYAHLCREFGLKSDCEMLPNANKVMALHERQIEPTRIIKFKALGARGGARIGPFRARYSRFLGYAEISQLLKIRTFLHGLGISATFWGDL